MPDLRVIAASPAVTELAELAGEYAAEIQRSPFAAPISQPQAFSILGIMAGDTGWYPSRLLTDDALRDRPELHVLLPGRGLLSDATDTDARARRRRVEAQHRSALAQGFKEARDGHPAYKNLLQIAGFRSVLDAFAAARDKSKQASPLRALQAEAQILACMTRPLFLLLAEGWRAAPTPTTMRNAQKAAKALLVAAKDGLHVLPSYWQAAGALEALLRDLDALPSRERGPRLDRYTALNVALASFENWLAIHFGREAANADLITVRQSYAKLIGFKNPRAKVSP